MVVVEVAGIEPASENSLEREYYVRSHIMQVTAV